MTTNNEQSAPPPPEQRPLQRSLCGTLRDETHWKCLILSVLMYGSLTVILWCELTTVEVVAYTFRGSPVSMQDSPCEDGYMYIPVAFLVLLYLVYLLECWYSEVRVEIHYREDAGSVYERVARVRDSFPVVWWRAISYHYNRHTRQVTRYRHGDTYTTTQEYFERINTHSAASAFDFTECGVRDVSRRLTGLEDYPITRVSFSKNFMFLNEESEYDYLSQRARFFGENDGRDENMETREGLTLTDVEFTDDMISYACSRDKLPWYFSMSVFWAMSFIFLSWPYRILVSYKTAVVDYQIEKLFGTNYSAGMLSMEHWNGETMHLTRVSTVGSNCSLESMIRGNRHVVPSYSEAVLMDLANGNVVPRPGQTPTGGGGTPLAASRTRSMAGSDGFLANGLAGRIAHSNGSRRGNPRRLFSFANARRSSTAPLHGPGMLAGHHASPTLRALGASAHLLITKDRLKGAGNGRASPISIRLAPSLSGLHLTGTTALTPRSPILKQRTDPRGRADACPNQVLSAAPKQEGFVGPDPPGKPAAADVQARRAKTRPTSLPLCFGDADLGGGGGGGGGVGGARPANQQRLQAWVVVDESRGLQTVVRQPPPAVTPRPNPNVDRPLATRPTVPVPEDSPPAYEVALEMEVPAAGPDLPPASNLDQAGQEQPSNINMETSL